MKSVLLAFVILGLLASSIEGLRKWTGYDADGTAVVRTINVLQSPRNGFPHRFHVRAVEREVGKNRKEKTAIEFIFATEPGPHFSLRHFTRDEDSAERTAARHALRKIVEYEENSGDSNGKDGFQPDIDARIQNYTLWDKTWSTIDRSDVSGEGGANVIQLCTHTTDNVVEICIFLSDIRSSIFVNGTKFGLDNNALHHTIKINNFPFQSNTSRLALKVHYEARSRVKDFKDDAANADKVDTNEGAVDLGEDGDRSVIPVASWAATVDVTGSGCSTTANVVRDVIRETEYTRDVDNFPDISKLDSVSFAMVKRFTYFSFLTDCAQPDTIYWDPDFGVVDNEESSSSMIMAPIFLIFAIIAMLF